MPEQPIHTAHLTDCHDCGGAGTVVRHHPGDLRECLSDACDRAPAGLHYAADFETIFDEEQRR